jgi:hypothetical protein
MRWSLEATAILLAAHLLTPVAVFASSVDSTLNPEPPLVVCQHQRYALCAEAKCFVYNGAAYCKCDVMRGDSISLQLSHSSRRGEMSVM